MRVFNPQPERDGWASPHTIVEVVTDDMPFLVDSLAVVLGDSRLPIQLMMHPVLRIARDRRGRLLSMDEPTARSAPWSPGSTSRCRASATRRGTEHLRQNILRMLEDVRLAVADWPAMRQRALRHRAAT